MEPPDGRRAGMETKRRKAERKVGREELDELMREVFGTEIHAQRVASLRAGVDGVLYAKRVTTSFTSVRTEADLVWETSA
jgi:hypothetical protein